MPNWCECQYTCVGSEEDIQKLHCTIDSLYNATEPLLQSDFGKSWLGCLVSALGGNWEEIRCRGMILDYWIRKNDGALSFNMESAWEEPTETRHFFESVFPGLKIFYIEEEPGNCIYRTNDSSGTYYPDRFLIDTHEGTEYFKSISDAAEYVLKLTGRKPKTKKEIVSALKQYEDQRQKEDEDAYYCFHEFKIVKEGGEK